MSIELQRHGAVLEVRLARPPVNALTPELLLALRAAVEAAPGQGARGIVLTGGEKVYSGGMDVPHLMSLQRQPLIDAWATLFAAARAIAGSALPVVAAIGGHAPAGGCVLALCCDYRVMASGPFRIGLNEVQVGLVAPDAIQYLLRRAVGTARAERLLVAGALVESAQAQALGLVDELAEQSQVLARSIAWLEDLLQRPATAMQATRRIARADVVAALAAFDDRELEGFIDDWYAPDTQAALQALLARLKK
ncbi:MAG: enoyl-CoA hydratase/isomerase family protein [Arenimonas sp.]|nr:enoyl-CoA hydratase/isomerase family protein [Arenimonas sp.]